MTTPTEREILRCLSSSEPMTKGALQKLVGADALADVLRTAGSAGLITVKFVRGPRGQLLGSGYVLTEKGADACAEMERRGKAFDAFIDSEFGPDPAHPAFHTPPKPRPLLARIAAFVWGR
jgi:hypothetical protein